MFPPVNVGMASRSSSMSGSGRRSSMATNTAVSVTPPTKPATTAGDVQPQSEDCISAMVIPLKPAVNVTTPG